MPPYNTAGEKETLTITKNMKTIKVQRKFKKDCKKAVLKRFPLCGRGSRDIGICGISTGLRYTSNPDFYILVGNKAITAHRMY